MVATKIVSKRFGSCKMVNIVWLGLPTNPQDPDEKVDPAAWPAMIDALGKVRKDIVDNDLKGKAYINISFGFQEARFHVSKEMEKSMDAAINGVTNVDALVIMAAGNDGKPINSYPQMLGQSNKRVVVIGSVDDFGNLIPTTSTAIWVKIHAVGIYRSALPFGPSADWGTSFSKNHLGIS